MSATAAEAVPAGKLYTVITHLAMEAPPAEAPPPAPAPGVTLERRRAMPVADYLRLYHAIGDDWLWWSRLTWDEARLAAHLAEEETEVYVAEADGAGDRPDRAEPAAGAGYRAALFRPGSDVDRQGPSAAGCSPMRSPPSGVTGRAA